MVGVALMMCYNWKVYGVYSVSQWMQALQHSTIHLMTVAGYVMALPLLLELVRIWCPASRQKWHRKFMIWYLALTCTAVFLAWAVNTGLYEYWGIPLDSTILVYLDNPKEVIMSTPTWILLLEVPLLLAVFGAIYWLMHKVYPKARKKGSTQQIGGPVVRTVLCLLLCGLDFLAIRGGVGTSTMNPGRAYFCSEMPLNHAAVNPFFNFLYSLGKQEAFDKQYRFMSGDEATSAMTELESATRLQAVADSSAMASPVLLKTKRPNILLIIFESFSSATCKALCDEADAAWMPNFNRMYQEGLGFTRFYANSFRTDRGVAAILASYPGQPNNSVMKDQSKCEHLQYLPKRLGEQGYRLQFIMGGDVDFTNRRGFLTSGGVTDIVGDVNFPDLPKGKWGVPDHMMFDYVHDVVVRDAQLEEPFFKTFLTISSHEPFDVPFHHFPDQYVNSVAYTDSCLGSFIDRLKADASVWDNLLVIGLPDHCFGKYPADVQQHDPLRYHIPMFWAGGALQLPVDSLGHEIHTVDVLGQQTDLSATLLGQLGINHDDFNFSKDLFDPNASHYAFYSFSDGFGLITDSCSYVQDNKQDGVGLMPGTSDPMGKAQQWGKAYLQLLYDDLARRGR